MPRSIRYFEVCSLGAIVIEMIDAVLSYDQADSEQTVAQLYEIGFGMPFMPFYVGILVLIWTLLVTLIVLTSRRHSNTAKWILIILTAGALFPLIEDIMQGRAGFESTLSWIATAVQLVGIYYLFTAEGRSWFRLQPAETQPG